MADSVSNNPFEAFSTTGSSLAADEGKHYMMNTQNASSLPLFMALPEDQKQQTLQLAASIDHTSYHDVIQFGKKAQEQLTQFTNIMLKMTSRQDVNATGKLLNDLIQQLEMIDTDALLPKEQGFFQKLFGKRPLSISEVMTQYTRLKVKIDRLSIQLEHSQLQLLKEFNALDQLYTLNEQYFHSINQYIAACELKLDELKTKLIPQAEAIYQQSNEPLQQHAIQDLSMQFEWLDKRKYDLEISREISIQSAPQIRMIQKTGQLLIDKIQTSVMTTIPLWQNQIAMILQMNQQRRIAQSEQRMLEASEKLARKNEQVYNASRTNASNDTSTTKQNIERFRETQLKLLQELEETLRVTEQTSQTLRDTETSYQ